MIKLFHLLTNVLGFILIASLFTTVILIITDTL